MEKIVVQGGDNRLVGSVTIEGAKNAVLPLLAATILASEGKTVLQNVPYLVRCFHHESGGSWSECQGGF